MLSWEMDLEKIEEFLPNVCCHVFTVWRIEPYDFSPAIAFSLGLLRGFIFQGVRVSCVVKGTLIFVFGGEF